MYIYHHRQTCAQASLGAAMRPLVKLLWPLVYFWHTFALEQITVSSNSIAINTQVRPVVSFIVLIYALIK